MAPPPRPPRPSRSQTDPLWLVVEQDGCAAQSFELRAETQRAVVFGAADGVDYRIEMAPAIAFFIERDGGELWVTPAYCGDEVRIDAQRLECRRRVVHLANVELRGTQLRLRVRDTPPTLRGERLIEGAGGDSLDRGSRGEKCVEDLPWANDSTPDIDRLFSALEAGDRDTPTTELTPRATHPIPAPAATREYSCDELMLQGILPSATTEMSRAELNELFDCGERAHAEFAHEKPSFLAAEPRECSQDISENGGPCPKVLQREAILLRPELRRPSPVERLGTLAKTQPLLAVAIAVVGALVAVLFLVAVAKLSERIGHMSEMPDEGATYPMSLAVESPDATKTFLVPLWAVLYVLYDLTLPPRAG